MIRNILTVSAAISALCFAAAAANAGTNVGNYNDGLNAASAFCRTVDNRAWTYAIDRDPVRGDFNRAALEVGSELETIYAQGAPADHRRVFRTGWEAGMQKCATDLKYSL